MEISTQLDQAGPSSTPYSLLIAGEATLQGLVWVPGFCTERGGCSPACLGVGGRSFGSPRRRRPATGGALSRAAGPMDAESLLLSLELASGSGQGLSPDRRASLLTSLTLVKRDYRYSRVLFWGRILGVVADYYIAQGLSENQLAPRKTLYRWRGLPGQGDAERAPLGEAETLGDRRARIGADGWRGEARVQKGAEGEGAGTARHPGA